MIVLNDWIKFTLYIYLVGEQMLLNNKKAIIKFPSHIGLILTKEVKLIK